MTKTEIIEMASLRTLKVIMKADKKKKESTIDDILRHMNTKEISLREKYAEIVKRDKEDKKRDYFILKPKELRGMIEETEKRNGMEIKRFQEEVFLMGDVLLVRNMGIKQNGV